MARELEKRKYELYLAQLVDTGPEIEIKIQRVTGKWMRMDSSKSSSKITLTFFSTNYQTNFHQKRPFEFKIRTDSSQPPASRSVIRLSYQNQQEPKRELDELLKRTITTFIDTVRRAGVFHPKERSFTENGVWLQGCNQDGSEQLQFITAYWKKTFTSFLKQQYFQNLINWEYIFS